jgi:hypothetical protein
MSRRRTIYRPANAEGVSERDPAEEVKLALTKPGAIGVPDVVMLSEVSWLDVPALAERLDLYAVQFGGRGSPEAGVALVSRKPIRDAVLIAGSDAGEGIRARGILVARTFGHTTAAIHVPPLRATLAQESYLDRLRIHGDAAIIGGDWNLPPMVVRRRYPERTYTGRGVLGVLMKPAAFDGLGATTPVNVRSDHPAVDVPVYRKVKR